MLVAIRARKDALMSPDRLAQIASKAKCRVFGHEDAGNEAHRFVLGALIHNVESERAAVLCEPSLVRQSHRPPDVVLVCPVSGVAVIEVKGITLDDIDGIDPGGKFVIRYSSGARSKDPFAQARYAMFDIKDASQRLFDGDLTMPFRYYVAMPRISRAAWQAKWGADALCPPELLFGTKDVKDLASSLAKKGRKRLHARGLDEWPAKEFQTVLRGAFGDTSVLLPLPDERKARRVREATLGEMFDDAAESYKELSDEQQKLSSQYWEKGPRLVRGVAGSGKTIVLANNLARRVQRQVAQTSLLSKDEDTKPRFLVVCFNRTLVPFIEKKINAAYRGRTGSVLPEGIVEVYAFNQLMWHKSQNGLWRYQKVFEKGGGDQKRAEQYLRDLEHARENDTTLFDQHSYDAIYVDEGQDFLEAEYRLLATLCNRHLDEPNLYVFYDDAQNLYGRKRPNWQSLGLNVLGGRAHVMTECFRNTKQTLEPAFNTLYGSHAPDKSTVPTKAFGDVSTLVEKGLLEQVDARWKVNFAKRQGIRPKAELLTDQAVEDQHIIARLRWLLEDQEVRPQDILVLAMKQDRIKKLVAAIEDSVVLPNVDLHVAFKDKDEPLGQRKRLTLSTVASAKGYDAYCVLLVSANEFRPDVGGRASFYVGCTRAIEYLEISGYSEEGLMAESLAAVGVDLPVQESKRNGAGGRYAYS